MSEEWRDGTTGEASFVTATPISTPALRVENLTVTTGAGVRVVDGATWEVAPGARLGIIGESGSGKSLTASAVLGLVPPGMAVSGKVLLGGQDLIGLRERQLRHIRGARVAMVFQEPLTALDPLMKVGEQIAGPLRLHTGLKAQAARKRAGELLEQVALRDTGRILGSYPWQLSGGQRQRASLAMALACEPELLIADEPTTALDVTVQAEILQLLNQLISQTGVTLIFITHDLPVMAQVADHVVVMKDGAVVEQAPVERLLRAPRHAYSRSLIESAREMTALPLPRTGGGHE